MSRETLIPRRGRRGGRGSGRRRRAGPERAPNSSKARPSPTSSPPRPAAVMTLYGRLIAEYMQRYLPGSTFVVKNVPGAGHLIGANAIYASKPDGLTIGTFNTGLIYNQLIQAEGVKFDLTKMSWIGKAASDAARVRGRRPIADQDLPGLVAPKEPLNFATAGIGSSNYVEINSLTNILKLPVKMLTGYNGNDDQLAMRRGEIAGGIGLALLVRAVREEWLWPLHRPDRRQTKGYSAAQGRDQAIRTA